MGIFNIFNSSKNEENRKFKFLSLLTEHNLNPYDYHHNNLEHSEISLSEELDGVVKCSDFSYFNNEFEYDYVSLCDYKDGRKSLFLSINQSDEKNLRKIVDKYIKIFGKDDFNNEEFNHYDLITIKEQKKWNIREWNKEFFKIYIGYTKSENLLNIYLYLIENSR